MTTTPAPTVARGSFDVALTPQPLVHANQGPLLARMSIDKTFHGDLEGTSRGEMLSAATATKGSAGYVAIERVEGTLHGRRGSFVLQHAATLDRGAPSLRVMVVPDSGTDELVGLAGSMSIDPSRGYAYEFEYTLASRG